MGKLFLDMISNMLSSVVEYWEEWCCDVHVQRYKVTVVLKADGALLCTLALYLFRTNGVAEIRREESHARSGGPPGQHWLGPGQDAM